MLYRVKTGKETGRVPLDGLWFGDTTRDKPRYWWRDYLPPRRQPRKKAGRK
jgi:hypothetical protein